MDQQPHQQQNAAAKGDAPGAVVPQPTPGTGYEGVTPVQQPADMMEAPRIEDMPLEKKLEFLKKFNYFDQYVDGSFIDAQDSVNTWCLGQIVKREERVAQIHYDGWSSKWDINTKLYNNYRVAPFRKYSRGYTGQQKIALRSNLKFSLEDLNNEKQRLERFIDDDLQGLGAFQTTQYLRGHLYIYVDFLLQNSSYPPDHADAINGFIVNVLRLIVAWLKKLPKLIPLYQQLKVNTDLFLIDENIALLQSAPEIMDILKKIFCGCPRCFKYYLLNDKQAVQFDKGVTNSYSHINFEQNVKRDEEEIELDQVKEQIIQKKNIVFGQFLNFLNYFAELGGFDALMMALKVGNDPQDERMPLEMISLLVSPFRQCNTVFAPTFAAEFTQQVRNILLQRLNTLTEKELKEIDKDSISRVLSEMKDFFMLSFTDIQTAEMIEMNQLNMALRFVKSTYLEKRLKGISDIKSMIERIENSQFLTQKRNLQGDTRFPMANDYQNYNLRGQKPLKYLNSDTLRDWILQQNLLPLVFGENTHLEIVKRSGCILKFLAKQSALPQESIDLLWKCQLGKHEEMVRVVYGIIQDLVSCLDVAFIDQFFALIKQVPASQYDDKFLEFLKSFTMTALEQYYEVKSHEGIGNAEAQPICFEDQVRRRESQVIGAINQYLQNSQQWDSSDKQYGLPIFWEMIQDRAPQVSNELTQSCIQCITQILKQTYSQPVKISFLIRALDNLCKGESVPQSVIIAQSIIQDFPTVSDLSETSLTIQGTIQSLESQLGLISKLIGNIAAYHGAVNERVRSLTERKKLPEDVSNFVFVGKHTHETTINLILQFIEFLILNSEEKVSLGTDNIDRLWRLFVQQPNFNADQTLFLQWINKTREFTTQFYDKRDNEIYLFNDQERKHFFTKILCSPTYVDFQRISIGQVKCFHKFFKIINKGEGCIEQFGKRMFVKDHEGLIGLDTLRRIAVETENERSRDESMDLLVDLHLRFDHTRIGIPQQREIWSNFIDHCMDSLDSENETLVSNTLLLLSKFLDRYEGKKALKPEMKHSQYGNYNNSLIAIFRPDMIKKQIAISMFQTVGHLRVKVAEAFGFQINEFRMHMKNFELDPDEDDDRYLKEYGLVQQVLVVKNEKYIPENHPKFLISEKQENYDKLFALLAKETKSHLIEGTWELLQKLPVNKKLQLEIKELNGMGMSGSQENKLNWEKILDPKSVNKLLYSLQIVSTMKKDPKASQWRYKFIQMGGLAHLLRTFLNLHIKSIETNLTLKCIDLLIVTLNDIMQGDKEKEKEQYVQNMNLLLSQKENVVQSCIRMVDLISDYSLAMEKKRGESYEDVTKRIFLNKQKKNKYKSYMAQSMKDKQQQNNNQDDDEDHESIEYNQMQQIIKQFNEQFQIVSTLFKFMQNTIFFYEKQSTTSAASVIAQYDNLENMLLKSTVLLENYLIRNEVLKRMREILTMRTMQPDMEKMINIVRILAFKIQAETEKCESRCSQYYDGLTSIIDSLVSIDIESLREGFLAMVNDLARFIYEREIKEKNTLDSDYLLIGKMKLLKSLLQKFPMQKQTVGSILTHHLVHNCLFEIPHGGTTKSLHKAGPPKCKSNASRTNALNLLAVLCRDCPTNLDHVLKYMLEFNQNPSWRTHKDADWNISLMDSEKSSTGYVGLKNLGCICYMNSLFQQLFMIQSLRNDILSVPQQSQDQENQDDNMLYQLQLLFAGLLKSEKQYVSPKGFCRAFKDWEGNPTNVLEQMDVEEFFNMLMDRIETAVKGSAQKDTIKYHFGGKFASEMICKACPHKYERSEDYLSLSISVKNQKSIQQSLNAFIQGEMLEGENAYFCEKCDKKVDTLKRTCIKKLPRYLIIALRRFEFDYDKMIRVKVNDYCEFPLDLNMEPYTQEGLSKRERIAKLKEEKGDADEEALAAIETIENEPLKYPKEYYDFALSGIVVHSGTADSGHYYSFIKDREHPDSGKWYEMNDHIVRDFDPNDIPAECFGGEDVFQGYGSMMQMKSMKWRNAYLLFYERKIPCEVNSDDEKETVADTKPTTSDTEMINTSTAQETQVCQDGDVEMVNTSTTAIPLQISISSEIEQKIIYENQKYWQNRFLFGNEYFDFVYDIGLYWNTGLIIPKNFLTKNNDFHLIQGSSCPKEYEYNPNIPEPLDVKLQWESPDLIPELELRVFKYIATFYLTIQQRSMQKHRIPEILNLLKAYMNKNEKCAQWLLQEFCNYELIEEMFLQCSMKQMRKFTAGLLYSAMLKLYPIEKDLLNDYWQNPNDLANNKTTIGNFALMLVHLLFEVKRFVANCNQYFLLFDRLSSLGPEMREFLLKCRVVGRLMEFFYDEFSPHKEFFRDMTDINPMLTEHPEIGLQTRVDRKNMNNFQEILENKRLKGLASGPGKYKYLFECVSNCIRAFKPGPIKTPLQLDNVNFTGLLQQEKDLYFCDSKFLKMAFMNAKKNRAMKALAMGYVHYTWHDKGQVEDLWQVIQLGLHDSDYADIKPFLTLLQYILMYPGGDKTENRFERTMLFFLDYIEQQCQVYYKFMETVIEWLFKLLAARQDIHRWFLMNKDKWQFLNDWSQTISFPLGSMDQNNNVRLYKKRGGYQQYPQYLKSEAYKNQFLQQARVERFKYVSEGKAPALPNELDLTLIDMEDYKFTVGQQVELYQSKTDTFQVVEVVEVLDEMLKVKYLNYNPNDAYGNQQSHAWIATDTDKFQPIGTYNSQYRSRLTEYFEKKHEEKVKSQTGNQMRPGDGDQEMMGADQRRGYNNYGYTGDNCSEEDDNDSNDELYDK